MYRADIKHKDDTGKSRVDLRKRFGCKNPVKHESHFYSNYS